MISRLTLFSLFAVVCYSSIFGETVVPIHTGEFWGVELRDLPCPKEDLRKGLKSGFTTTSVIEVRLLQKNQEVHKARAVLKQFFELWEERYQLEIETAVDNHSRSFRQMDALLNYQENFQIPRLGKWRDIASAGPYEVRVRYLLTPIEKAKAEKIRKWIVMNRTSGAGTPQTTSNVGVTFNRLFNSILDEYFSTGNQAKWEFSVKTGPVNFKEVKRAGEH